MSKKKPSPERSRWNNAAAVVLAATRSDSDTSQVKLARLVGLSRHVIANMEAGRRRVELSDLIMICRALHLDPLKILARVLRWYEPVTAQWTTTSPTTRGTRP